MIKFECDRVERRGITLFVPGKVLAGTVKLGTTFRKVGNDSIAVELTVVGIEFFQRTIDEVEAGFTAGLSLTGEGSEVLAASQFRVVIYADG